jgi:hypothetical protein
VSRVKSALRERTVLTESTAPTVLMALKAQRGQRERRVIRGYKAQLELRGQRGQREPMVLMEQTV